MGQLQGAGQGFGGGMQGLRQGSPSLQVPSAILSCYTIGVLAGLLVSFCWSPGLHWCSEAFADHTSLNQGPDCTDKLLMGSFGVACR
jgi:hypothetical protein